MALREATGSSAVLFGDEDEGKVLEGYYTGAKPITTKFGERSIHALTTRDRKTIEAWGSAQLDRKLAEVPPHAFTRIEFLGKQSRGSNGQSMKVFRVLFDEDDVALEQQEIPV